MFWWTCVCLLKCLDAQFSMSVSEDGLRSVNSGKMPQLALGIMLRALRLASNWEHAPRSSDWKKENIVCWCWRAALRTEEAQILKHLSRRIGSRGDREEMKSSPKILRITTAGRTAEIPSSGSYTIRQLNTIQALSSRGLSNIRRYETRHAKLNM